MNSNKAINVISISPVSALITDPQQSKTHLNLTLCANTHVIHSPYWSGEDDVPPPSVSDWPPRLSIPELLHNKQLVSI